MTPLLLAAAVTVNIDLGRLFHRGRPATPPQATCHISTVSYRFVGEPGTEFIYEGDRYVVPAEGSIELIAGKSTTDYQIAGRRLRLDVWPRDEFGSRTVPLPTRAAIAEMKSTSTQSTR